MSMPIHGRHYATGSPIEVHCADGVMRAVSPTNAKAADDAPWISPAWFDLQINGCDGRSFNSPKLSLDDVRHVVRVCRRHGIGSLCPTLVTNGFDALAHGFRTLREACERDADLARALPAFHLEGPYISAEDGPRGAHPRAHVRPPNWDEFRRLQDAAGGRIRLVTLAPETTGALPFIERLTQAGVVVSLGHTAANGACIRAAIVAGARLSTHLGNGCYAVLPRHDNVIWEQLAADELSASIIADGHHLPATVVRCIARVKTPARLILTCDASSLAGLPPGRYREWDQDFEVLPTGKVIVSGTSLLAGSGVFTDVCVGNVMRMAGVSLAEAVSMVTERPRRLLGLPASALEPRAPADLVLFDWKPGGDVRVRRTIIAGVAVA